MARRRRVDLAGAVYHITVRGNQQRRIFFTCEDYRVYLSLLREAVERFGLRVLAYALLPNHVHLLCRRGPVPLAKVMHHVQRRFAVHHNRRLGVRGHVFQDRYHAKLCEEEGYLWAVVRYIHDNPVQAGLCDRPEGYRWTSYHAYASGQWDLVDREEATQLFGRPEGVRELPSRRQMREAAGCTEGVGGGESRAQRVQRAEASARSPSEAARRGGRVTLDGSEGRAAGADRPGATGGVVGAPGPGEWCRGPSPRPPP